MILQALCQYYDRKSKDPKSRLAPFGFENKEIPFVIEISNDGEFIQIEDTRTGEGKKKVAQSFLVPQGVKRSVGISANLLWDNSEYAIKLLNCGKLKSLDRAKRLKYIHRLREQHHAFREQHHAFTDRINGLVEQESNEGLDALRTFLKELKKNKKRMSASPSWTEICETSPNITFRLQGNRELICQSHLVIKTLSTPVESNENSSPCLITGNIEETERLHAAIKGVWGAQTAGANIVSFNLEAFRSWGKKQGANAPVGTKSVFAYTTALNHLLRKSSSQRMQVGDTSTVFWAEKASALEEGFVNAFTEPPKDNPDRNTQAVQELYKSMHNGRYTGNDLETRFYVLGLAPNAARIAIRFWHVATVGELAERIIRHFDDLKIVHREHEPQYLSLFRLLVSVSLLGKSENIPPNLAGEIMRAILEGLPYPQKLLAATIRRIRAEQEVTYPRAAIIKAYLNRKHSKKEQLNMALDLENPNIGYRLGRLFSVLEKVQEEANPGLNATIRDRYYGAASSTPVTVFSTLIKLSKHHLSKLAVGRSIYFERLTGEIISEIQDFSPHLSLEDQGRFAIGYYHQRQDFFKKKQEKTENGEDK